MKSTRRVWILRVLLVVASVAVTAALPWVLRLCAEMRLMAYEGSTCDRQAIRGSLRLLALTSSEKYLESRYHQITGPGTPVWAIALGLKSDNGKVRLRRLIDDPKNERKLYALVGIGWSDPTELKPYLQRNDDPALWLSAVSAARMLGARELVPLIKAQMEAHPQLRNRLAEAWLRELEKPSVATP